MPARFHRNTGAWPISWKVLCVSVVVHSPAASFTRLPTRFWLTWPIARPGYQVRHEKCCSSIEHKLLADFRLQDKTFSVRMKKTYRIELDDFDLSQLSRRAGKPVLRCGRRRRITTAPAGRRQTSLWKSVIMRTKPTASRTTTVRSSPRFETARGAIMSQEALPNLRTGFCILTSIPSAKGQCLS